LIAISYRREDSLPVAGRLYDRLQAQFGKPNVFMDFDSIPPGMDFREQIRQMIERSKVVIAIIGPHWLGEQADASRRIDHPADFVRLEIAHALKHGIPVIPVLIDDTVMPSPDKLPPEIEGLAFRNAVTLDTGIDFHHHADRLIAGIGKVMEDAPSLGEPGKTRTRYSRKTVAGAGAILLAFVIAAIWFFAAHRLERSEGTTKQGPGAEGVKTSGAEAKAEESAQDSAVSSPALAQQAAEASPTATSASAATSNPSLSQSAISAASLEGYNPGIAFVDMNRIFKEFAKTKDAETKINEAKHAAATGYDDRTDVYKKTISAINDLNNEANSNTLSASAKAAKLKERDGKIASLKKIEQEISDFRTAREKELKDQALASREGLVLEIVAQITAETREFKGVVFDKSGMSLNGVPVMMFTPDAADMSSRVISGLNENQSSPLTASHNLSFAVVDMNRIFKEYRKTKQAEGKVNAAKTAAKKEYEDRAESYKKTLDEINELNKKLNSSSTSGTTKQIVVTDRDEKMAKLKKLETEINQFRQAREKQLQEQALTMREGIVKEITDTIAAKLDRRDTAIIIDSSGKGMDGVPCAVFVRGVPDYSDEVIAALNEGGEKASSKFSVSMAAAGSLRVGVIDMGRAFKSWPDTQGAKAEIAAARAAVQKEYGEASKEVRDDREKAVQAQAKTLPDRIVAKITASLEADAGRKEFNLIFDSSGKSLNGIPVVVIAPGLPDLTDDVLKK
jgi:Skp family chaperone for outer membrane proteins